MIVYDCAITQCLRVDRRSLIATPTSRMDGVLKTATDQTAQHTLLRTSLNSCARFRFRSRMIAQRERNWLRYTCDLGWVARRKEPPAYFLRPAELRIFGGRKSYEKGGSAVRRSRPVAKCSHRPQPVYDDAECGYRERSTLPAGNTPRLEPWCRSPARC